MQGSGCCVEVLRREQRFAEMQVQIGALIEIVGGVGDAHGVLGACDRLFVRVAGGRDERTSASDADGGGGIVPRRQPLALLDERLRLLDLP